MDSDPQAITLRRYALAHALIPDADEADELFRLSRDETDLRRRASRWLAQRGEMLLEVDPPLAPLDSEQQAHALHLARLGRKRRVALPLAVGAAVLAIALALVLGTRNWSHPVLAVDPVYHAPALAEKREGGLDLVVHKAELDATTGTLSLWWELTGPSADRYARGIHPEVRLKALHQEWQAVTRTVLEQSSRERVLGRAEYTLSLPWMQVVELRFQDVLMGNVSATWQDTVPLAERGHNPAERVVNLGRSFKTPFTDATIVSIRLAPTYTVVTYDTNMAPGGSVWQEVGLQVAGQTIPWLGRVDEGYSGRYRGADVFTGLPAGTRQVALTYYPWGPRTGLGLGIGTGVLLHNGNAPEVLRWVRNGRQLTAAVRFRHPWNWLPTGQPQLSLFSNGHSSFPVTLQAMKVDGAYVELEFAAQVDPTWNVDQFGMNYQVPPEDMALHTEVDLIP